MSKADTQEEFIKKVRKKHGNKFDLSLVKYVNQGTPVEVICNDCGYRFKVRPNTFLAGSGCFNCYKLRRRKKPDSFKNEVLEKRGDIFDLSLTNYVNNATKITVICKCCGKQYEKFPLEILRGWKCPHCRRERLRQEYERKFITNAIAKFGDAFDYSQVHYVNQDTPVRIKCNKCGGWFEQKPYDHLKGVGCLLCCDKIKNKFKGLEQFIIDAKAVHGELYDYSFAKYKGKAEKLEIVCRRCGHHFWVKPNNHLTLKQGCPICGRKSSAEKRMNTTEYFIAQSKEIHGEDAFDYSLVKYRGNKKKVKLICKTCGEEFEVKPNNHITLKQGCPHCSKSKGEKEVKKFLQKHNIVYETQKTFDGCKNKKHLHFDFYLPELNTCIEYDGQQHFKPVDIWGGDDNLKGVQKRDQIKSQYCVDNNIKLIRIKYDQDIEQILTENLF